MSAELRILRWGACALKEIEGGDFSGVLFSGSRSEPDFYAASFPLRASVQGWLRGTVDRKSTRLNSSHTVISYAVFCLKKKKQHRTHRADQPSRIPMLSDAPTRRAA